MEKSNGDWSAPSSHLRLWMKGEEHMIWCVCVCVCVVVVGVASVLQGEKLVSMRRLLFFFPPVVIKSLVGRRLLSPPKLFPEYMNTLLSFKRNKCAIIWGKREQEERAKPSQTASLPAFVRDQHRLPLPFPSIATNKWLLQLTGLLSVSLLVFVRPDKLPHSKFCPL